MMKSIVATAVLGLVVSAPAWGQSDSNQNQVGTSRASGAVSRSREDAPSLRGKIQTSTNNSKTRNLKFQFLNQSYAYQRDLTQGERPLASNYTYAGVTYRFKPSQYLSFRMPFSYYMPKYEGESRFEMEDVYLNYWHADIATLFKDTSLAGMVRLYLPTGEDSRYVDKRNGALRGTLMTSTDFAKKWNVSLLGYVQVNSQTQETYQLNGRTWANIDRTFVEGATLSYQLTDKLSFSQLLGTTSNFAETGDRYGDTEHFLNAVSSVYYQITEGTSASLAFHNDVEIGDDLRPFRLGMDEDITYILSIAATL